MHQIAKENLLTCEQKIFEKYLNSVYQIKRELQERYQKFVNEIGKNMQLFMKLLDRAFAPDIRMAFEKSVTLAKSCSVPVDEILDSKEKITSYFKD